MSAVGPQSTAVDAERPAAGGPDPHGGRLRTMIESVGASGADERDAEESVGATGANGRDAEESGRRSSQAERCGLCGQPIGPEHKHILDLDRRELHCACRACSILFDHSGAGGPHFRLVPERCLALDRLRLDDLGWRALGIPVEMAFFVREARGDRVRAFYPSPAGPTESQLPLDSWGELVAANPALAEIEADVEALLVDRTGERTRAYVVGIDQCFRLVGVVRTHWRGFTGGERVWREIESFFAQLRETAETR